MVHANQLPVWLSRFLRAAAIASLVASTRALHAQPAVSESGTIVIPANHSVLVRLPWPAVKVAITETKIADVQMVSPTQALVIGRSIGSTTLIATGQGETTWSSTIDVQLDPAALKTEFARLFPRARLDLTQVNGTLVISGKLASAQEAEQLKGLMDASGFKYADLTVLPGVPQVQLKVTIAEASRSAIRALGINMFAGGTSAFGGSNIGPENSGPINPLGLATTATPKSLSYSAATAVSPVTTLFGGLPSADLEVFVQALAENQYLRILAEPTLVALSGKEASFLAGGEFPIPVPQNSGGSTTITIQYKEFGVRLRFRPIVEGDGEIRLHVAPEESDITNGPGAVQVSGFNIPALLTRRAETELKLHSGQTFAMAGLISHSVNARNSRVPGLGDLPVLGPLFRSVRYEKGDTELLVLVTASVVQPTDHAGTVPGDAHVDPDDWQLYGLGMIEGSLPPAAWQNSHFADLTDLRGPGAWAPAEPAAAPESQEQPGK